MDTKALTNLTKKREKLKNAYLSELEVLDRNLRAWFQTIDGKDFVQEFFPSVRISFHPSTHMAKVTPNGRHHYFVVDLDTCAIHPTKLRKLRKLISDVASITNSPQCYIPLHIEGIDFTMAGQCALPSPISLLFNNVDELAFVLEFTRIKYYRPSLLEFIDKYNEKLSAELEHLLQATDFLEKKILGDPDKKPSKRKKGATNVKRKK